jgi:hypothetical protein
VLTERNTERTLFEIFDPAQVEWDVEETDRALRESRDRSYLGTGVSSVDYLVDQLLYLKAAREEAARRGLDGLAALEWVEYMSWPECRRRARTWRRELLHRYAFEKPAARWQSILRGHSPDEAASLVGPLRARSDGSGVGVYPPPILYLGPYPAAWIPPRFGPISLEGHIVPAPPSGYTGSALVPLRRLNQSRAWTLYAYAARIYGGSGRELTILLDEPRDYSAAEAAEQLRLMARELGSSEQAEDCAELIAVLQQSADALLTADSADRALILETLSTIPGLIRLSGTQPEIIPEDLPPEWLGVFIGFAFERKGLLPVRDVKKLRRSAATVLEQWQSANYEGRGELTHAAANRIVHRLADMRRLLTKKSLFAYLAKSVPGAIAEAHRNPGWRRRERPD